MEKYKRLTGRKINNVMELHEYQCECVNRLAELEDKIENGTLIELPCKVGDTVYLLWEYQGISAIAALTVEDISIEDKCINTNLDSDDYDLKNKYNWGYFGWEEIGKTVFLTKAEAEKRLEELQNEKLL